MLSAATFLSLAVQCAPSVHPDTAHDVARVESGFNQYAIGVVGQKKGIFPKSLDDALAHVQRLQAQGKRYSVGLMQITSTNFKKYDVTAAQLFSPCTNLSVFEKVITDCYSRGGTLKRALSCYYSGNFTTGQKSEKDFAQTSYVERIGYTPPNGGYIVPSTKAERGEEPKTEPRTEPPPYTTPNFESWDVLREYPRPSSQEKNDSSKEIPTKGDKADT